MKRFWTDALLIEAVGGWGVALDGRPLKTPARDILAVASERLARGIVAEWAAVGVTVDPRAMPLTGLSNAAIDQVAPDPNKFAEGIGKYATADLLCYRSESPVKLVGWQGAEWDLLLAWARRHFDVDFVVTSGVMHADQPAATIARLRREVAALDGFRLAGLSPLVTIGGSLVTALALLEDAVDLDTAWRAVSLDDRWQIEQWGDDTEAVASLAGAATEFAAAKRFLDLLD